MITITRLSSPPKHHFYGYYGIEAWDPSRRYHLSLETDFHEHRPVVGDVALVGLIDRETHAFIPYASTSAFNLQQGSMMHWIDVGFGNEFTFNDWENDGLVSRAINLQTRETRTICGAVAAALTDPTGCTRTEFCPHGRTVGLWSGMRTRWI